MKKFTVILLSVLLFLSACLLCSCEMQTQATDSATFRIDDRPDDVPPAGEPAENMAGVLDGREIIEVRVSSSSKTDSILPLFDYGSGVIRSERLNGETPVNTYPVTVEFHGDFVTLNYYVESSSGAAQRSLVTGKDNVIIYFK